MEGFLQTQISTLAVKDDFLVAGGFQGELTCKVSQMLAAIHVDISSFFGYTGSEVVWFLNGNEL